MAEPHLYEHAEELFFGENSTLEAQMELILVVLQKMLEHDHSKLEVILTPEFTTRLEGALPDRIAQVISRTFLEMGESAELADDVALELIRDLLLGYDETIILRNEGRILRRWTMRPAKKPNKRA